MTGVTITRSRLTLCIATIAGAVLFAAIQPIPSLADTVIASVGKPKVKILCLGDSLTEGYGVDKDKAYPTLVQQKFVAAGRDVQIINAGSSGSTSASGVDRLKWYLKGGPPQALFLELGANDGLRGQSLEGLKKNLRAVIDLAKSHNIQVLLAGMFLPTNYGKTYTEGFHKVFSDLAKEENLPLMPFLLDGVAIHADLMQPDHLHPNEKGHVIVADKVFQFLQNHVTALSAAAKGSARAN
jgi:acyl-CoA thioesterase I